MQIASINPESTIDYPGKYGPIIFTLGCSFQCGFCHNPELVNGDSGLINQEEFGMFLKNLKIKSKRGWYTGICISGGEPTQQKDLPEFILEIKQYGLAVKLDTNGSNPEMLRKLLEEKLVDYAAMDIKSKKEDYFKIVNRNINLENIGKSIKLVKQFPDYEFRTTVLPFFEENDFEEIGKWISEDKKVKLYSLQQFNPKKTLDSEYGKMIPKTKQELEAFAEIMKDYSENVRILGC
ncbi:MAG: anaerobic ribonucleoside-triphosphate reductase activating protein [Nanoarchaeota archaeon]|nr:anaerobic ribonucleoside-triphosphate reductase activating protein [Nanoarchaeota archaeon]